MAVSTKERNQAKKVVRDTSRLERIGVREARKITAHMERRVIAAYRRGRDPTIIMAIEFYKAARVIRDDMVSAHLTGLRRSQITAPLRFARGAYAETVDVLRRRLKMSPKALKELSDAYEAEAVRVLSTASASAEKALQTALVEITEEGLTVRQGTAKLRQVFVNKGISPRNSFTLEAIFRTQTQLGYSAGQWMQEQDPAIQEILWGYKYVTVGDTRVRPNHAAIDGVTLPKDDPFWEENRPPNGWACRCQAIPLYEETRKKSPPEAVIVDGKSLKPGADKGFRFNPGTLLGLGTIPSN